MPAPANARFTASHEWILAGEEIAAVGVSDHARAELGALVYIARPPPGRVVEAREAGAVIEAVKAASDIYAPVAGEIVEVNGAVSGETSLVNTDPYGAGWLFMIKPANPADVDALMDEATYSSTAG